MRDHCISRTSLRQAIRFATAFSGLLIAAFVSPVYGEVVFPEAAWEFKTPGELGMNGASLDQIAGIIGGNGCIVRDGYMVKTWGSQSAKGDWASASKPVVSTLLFFAIEEGKLSSVDDYIMDQGWALNTRDQAMTFRHLANMTGNYTRGEAPGAAWAYNDYNIQLYVKTLFDRVYGQTSNTAAVDPSRLGALQLQDGSLFASNNRIQTSVRDFARIGWFWANKGNWNGTQILPQHYFDDYMHAQVSPSLPRTTSTDPAGDYLGIGTYGGGSDQTPYGPGIYGFNWWFNGTGGLHPTSMTWPDAPPDTFQANGHWNREVVTIMPDLRLVMAYFGGTTPSFQPGSSSGTMNQVLKLLAESVPPDSPLISLNLTAINRVVDLTEDLPADTFTINNGGAGALEYLVSDDRDWLEVNPGSGSSMGETDTITISYDVGLLAVGSYMATIQVTDNGSSPPAANSPQVIEVTVQVRSVLPDFDDDGDVDQADFGYLQACFTESGSAVTPACQRADVDGDDRVDQADVAAFQACMSGADIKADSSCDDSLE